MWIAGYVVLLILIQLAVGGLVVGAFAGAGLRLAGLTRRQWVRLPETVRQATRAAAVALPAATLLSVGLWLVVRTPPEPGNLSSRLWLSLVLCGLFGGPGAMGCLMVVTAGIVESRGWRRRAARRVDTAGRLMFLSCAAYAATVLGGLALSSPQTRGEWLPGPWSAGLIVLSAIALGLAGFVGLLAGLSRKPRPSGTFAAVLYLASQWALLSAVGV